jgi:GDPmannose 4,6-dehydratase
LFISWLKNILTPAINIGDVILRIDKRYFRPTEVETLLGDSSLAKKNLNWMPEISIDELIEEMIKSDLNFYKK